VTPWRRAAIRRPARVRRTLVAAALLFAGSASGAVADKRAGRIGTHDSGTQTLLTCEACHQGHVGQHPLASSSLLARTTVCTSCHGGSRRSETTSGTAPDPALDALAAAATDVIAAFAKPSRHPLLATEVRPTDSRRRAVLPRRTEDLAVGPASEGVGCTDCHDPHARVPPRTPAGAGSRSGDLLASDGAPITESSFCLGCHGSSRILAGAARGVDVESAFALDAVSAHPVDLAPASLALPGLRRDAAGDGRLSCSSCHGNDDPGGPRGPHGSQFKPLLVAEYSREDGQVESPQAYALCYRCHDRGALLGGDTRFPLHGSHVQEHSASCAACHAAHGSREYPHLVAFDPAVVTASATGDLAYEPVVPGARGSCTLRCHGRDHAGATY